LKVEYGGFQHTDLVDLNNAIIDFLNLHLQFNSAWQEQDCSSCTTYPPIKLKLFKFLMALYDFLYPV